MPRRPEYKYGDLQKAGEKQQQWMDNNNRAPCPVAKCTLNFHAFQQDGWEIEHSTDELPPDMLTEPVMNALSLVSNDDIKNNQFEEMNLERPVMGEKGQKKYSCTWSGRTGSGTIFIEDVKRASNYPNPHISEIALAIYTKNHDIDSLKRVFVNDIANEKTCEFIKKQLYTRPNKLSWPDPKARIWEHGTPEYQALLGTPIGKMVAAMVLGGFAPGTRRIARIASWQAGSNLMPQLRFDIERV